LYVSCGIILDIYRDLPANFVDATLPTDPKILTKEKSYPQGFI